MSRRKQEAAAEVSPLAAERLRQGLTRAEVAERVGLSRVTVWRIETGQDSPRHTTRLLLAAALGCSQRVIFPAQHGDTTEDSSA